MAVIRPHKPTPTPILESLVFWLLVSAVVAVMAAMMWVTATAAL